MKANRANIKRGEIVSVYSIIICFYGAFERKHDCVTIDFLLKIEFRSRFSEL